MCLHFDMQEKDNLEFAKCQVFMGSEVIVQKFIKAYEKKL